MRNRILAAALAVALIAAAPISADAGPISGYPAASTPLSGSETVIGTQSGSTVQITAASIAAIVTGATNTWTGVQTFPAPGASHGSLVLTPGTATGTPPNGSIWTTSSGLFAEIGGAPQQYATLGANTFTGTQTFADGGTWSSGGVSGLTKLAMSGSVTDGASSVGLAFVGSGRIDLKTGSTELAQFYNNSGVGGINVNAGGVIGFGSTANPSAAFSWIGSDELALGNGTAGDETGKLDLKNIAVSSEVFLPDGGTLKAAGADTFGGYLQFSNLETIDPTASTFPSGIVALITSGWAPNAGLAFKAGGGGASGSQYYLNGATAPLGWDLQFFNEVGYQVFGIEHGAEDNHSLEMGGLRVCTVMYTTCGPSQIMFTDGVWNGSVTGLGSLVGGSGYVNGVYQDVPMTGSATGELLNLDITVSSGVVASAVLHTPPRPGFWYHVGDVLTTSNSNLGGTGSGFSITTTSVSTGAAAGPVIMMQSPQDFVGFGQAALGADGATSENAIRLGGSGNSGFPWDTNPTAQPSLTMGGALILGVGLTEEAQLRGTSTGGIAVTAPNSATAAPISASVVGVSQATWANNQTCTAGQITADASFIYVCTAANTVKRAALSSF